jgi:membrane-bound metal-dependent hydrolase YbcI (DUF457 family)
MFIGHFAVAFAAKKAAPKTSLGTLVIAAQLVDLVWPAMLLLGAEHVRISPGNTAFTPLEFTDYPYTHSLVAAVLWSLAFGAVYFRIRRYSRGALVIGAAVFSHWLLDLLTHRPDLPIAPGLDAKFGLGLWNVPAATVVVESALYIAGVALYLRTTRAEDRTGTYATWGFVLLLVLIYVANIFGPPPPTVPALAYTALALWLFAWWAFWADRHRSLRTIAQGHD